MARGLAAVAVILALSALMPLGTAAAQPPAQRWIVKLAPGAPMSEVVDGLRARAGVNPSHRFSRVMRGFAASMSETQREALLRDPRVAAVVPDVAVTTTADPQAEAQPGVRRVGALDNPDRPGTALDVDIAVLDTGIQPDHPELRVAGGYNCTDPSQTEQQRQNPVNWADGTSFGHGTHVAGIAAARQDGQTPSGVAAGARLWAIKVLTSGGNGYWSWVICGLERVAAMRDPADPAVPRIEVVNMSLASAGWDDGNCGHSNDDLLHQAICDIEREGVTMVAAAGNNSTDAAGRVPGAYDEVITVSAMADWNGAAAGSGTPPTGCVRPYRDYADDAFAGFSNYGPDVDLIAPGACVLSTAPTSTTKLMSGTSMATPHVAGGAALYHLWELRHGRPRPTPQQVRAALVERGTFDWKTATDPDIGMAGGAREPALNVTDFDIAPGFSIGSTPQLQWTSPGGAGAYDVWLARLGGFDADVTLSVNGASLPPGVTATFEPDGVAAAAGGGWTRLNVSLADSTPGGTFDFGVVGQGGGLERRASLRLIVDRAAESNGGPTVNLRNKVQTGSISLPVRVKWPKVANAGKYEVEFSRDGGAWTFVGRTRRLRMDTSIWPASRYRFRVRPKVGGIWREWKVGAASLATPYYAPDDGVTVTGTWLRANISQSYSELVVYSTQPGARATLAFTGRSVAWIASRGPTRGKARVFIDGVRITTIDLYASSTQHRRVVFTRSWTWSAPRTLRIEVVGTSGRPRVDVDAVVVISTD